MSSEKNAAKKEAERIIEIFTEVRELGFSITDDQVKSCAAICVKEILGIQSNTDGVQNYYRKVLEYIKTNNHE